MKTSLFAAIALAILATSHAVQGVPVRIDLGAPGRYSTDTMVRFSALNGTALLGQSLSVDFVFTNSQYVRLFTGTTSFSVLVTLQTNGFGFVGFLHGTGYLTDCLGNALEPPENLGSASSYDGRMLVDLYPQVSRPIDFYGVHFDLIFPTNPTVVVTGGQFRLFSNSGPFGIGPSVPDTGSTAILLGTGFLGIVLFSRRLDRNTRATVLEICGAEKIPCKETEPSLGRRLRR